MWSASRLDIAWRDLAAGMGAALLARDAAKAARRLESRWAPDGDGLACLSVRSAFDLMLSCLDLPESSEVLFSAVTLPDMVAIARAHGLRPVPVDVAGADLHVDPDALRRALSPRARVLVVAHLFGARPELTPVLDLARDAGLFVIEDCAQTWCGPEYRGDPRADASLFSFGTIKTATALGGALARVSDGALLERMRARQDAWPVETQRRFGAKVLKYAALRLITTWPVFALLVRLARLRGIEVDDLVRRLTRGFPGEDLLAQIRKRPCAALLELLDRRLRTYDTRRVERRIQHARRLLQRSGLDERLPELTGGRHAFWLFPFPSRRPARLVERLGERGIHATRFGSLEVTPPPPDRPELECRAARRRLDAIVFVPCYPELPRSVVERAGDVLEELERGGPGPDGAGSEAGAALVPEQPRGVT